MRNYETMVIVDAMISDDAIAAEIKTIEDKILATGGEIIRRDDWGKRKLAYPIKRRTHGFYSVFFYKSPDASIVSDIDAGFRINDNMVRWLSLVDHPMTDRVFGQEEDSLPPIEMDDERDERD
jgi:small subunit ribosomal protein S6